MSRHILRALSSVAVTLVTATSAMGVTAQTVYPERPVTLVVPFSAGGTTDLLGRLLADQLTQRLGQTVVVENRAGAGSTIGTNHVAKSKPDGYTLLLATSSSLVVAPVFTHTPYDSARDFAPVSIVAASPFAMFVGPHVPANTTAELIDLAKSKPGSLNMASFGTGSSSHLAGELFKSTADVDMVHVPYQGSAPAMTDMIGGEVDVMFDMVSAALPHHKAGKIRVLGVTGNQPSAALPGVPTVKSTVPGYEATAWFGVVAPAGTPSDIVGTLNNAIVAALDSDDVKALLGKQALEPVGSSPEHFAQVIESDLSKWKGVIEQAGVKVEQ